MIDEPTRRPHCGRGIPAVTLIGRRISRPQWGSVRLCGLVGNSKPYQKATSLSIVKSIVNYTLR